MDANTTTSRATGAAAVTRTRRLRLRRSNPSTPGWTRRGAGRGFTYLDHDGVRLAAEDAQRCRDLVIPPAWRDVWICPWPHGHIQAVGYDAAGRKQYLYHPQWRLDRDAEKFDHVLTIAAALPAARRRSARDLSHDDPSVRASAVAFRMLDLGLFRIGSEQYAEDNGSYGLTTLEKRHVTIRSVDGSDVAVFDYVAKSGKQRYVALDDTRVVELVGTMRRRRGGSQRLLAYRDGSRWRDLRAEDVNAYVKRQLGEQATAKDFRTWHATVLASVALAASAPTTDRARKRAVAAVMREVSDQLGNTPAVCRASYVDPRVVDLYDAGSTLAALIDPVPGLPLTTRHRASTERAVLELLAP